MAATIAQSCLTKGNLVDGKFKPYICNDVAVVVFKAFVSTEDGKLEFTPVETFVGSLDPDGKDEKGRDFSVCLLEDGNILLSVFFPGEGGNVTDLNLFLVHPEA
jgi:hypothetical protein